MVKLLSIVVIFLAASVASADEIRLTKPERVGMSSERLENVGVGMRKLIDENKIPGTVSLVARQGKVVHFEANGLRNIATGEPMELDTIFRLYSQTKPVTGVAVMILFEEGHFLLSDPIAKYLPEFKDMVVYKGEEDGDMVTEPARPITIHHLLTHTSGLTYNFFPTPVGKMYVANGIRGTDFEPPSELTGSGGPREFKNLQEWSEALAEMPLVAQPGTEWHYSVGMDVLGRLVEVVSGQSYAEFLEERIFAPLGMNDTGFYVPEEKISRFAAMYVPNPEGGMTLIDDPKQSWYLKPPTLEMGGSGLVGTVGDYLKFAQMLANRGEYNGTRILGSKTTEFMMSDHMGPRFPPNPLSTMFGTLGGDTAWGIGFGLTGSVITDPALVGRPISKGLFSWGGAASTHFWVDLEEEMVGIVHTQLLPDGTYPVSQMMQLLTYQAVID